MKLPGLTQQEQSRSVIETFRGFNHNLKIAQGEWYDEGNLTAEQYPLMAPRKKRGVIGSVAKPLGMLAKDALMYIDGSSVIYNGSEIQGLRLSTSESMLPKQMVSMGALAVIFPDKVYINTADGSYGSLDAAYSAGETGTVRLTMCRVDGSDYDLDNAAILPEAPANPANGDLWIDISSSPHQLRQYAEATKSWVDIVTVYVKIRATGIADAFEVDDGVNISGLTAADAALNSQLQMLNGDHIIVAKGGDDSQINDYIVITGILDSVHTQTGGLRVRRECPDLDYVCESNNRIWGCRYGYVSGVGNVNEIYACKLGDPKNWRCYAGSSTDSYAVTVGTDGRFTGAITHLGYPLFFKEDCVHKVYGTMPSNYQLQTTTLRGIQQGSWRSAVIVNEVLYYLSRSGVVAYDGSLPTGMSEALGGVRYKNGAAGSDGRRYFISMQAPDETWSMFVLDTERGIWHREDGTQALCFANVRGDLQYMDASGMHVSVTGASGTEETEPVEWYAESGLMGYELPDSKYLSRFDIRARVDYGAKLEMYIEYDSCGGWIKMGEYTGMSLTRTVNIPVIPRRCDHLRLKLAGRGDIRIFSIAHVLEGGSDVWL